MDLYIYFDSLYTVVGLSRKKFHVYSVPLDCLRQDGKIGNCYGSLPAETYGGPVYQPDRTRRKVCWLSGAWVKDITRRLWFAPMVIIPY